MGLVTFPSRRDRTTRYSTEEAFRGQEGRRGFLLYDAIRIGFGNIKFKYGHDILQIIVDYKIYKTVHTNLLGKPFLTQPFLTAHLKQN